MALTLERSLRVDGAADVELVHVVVRSAVLADVIKFSVEGSKAVRAEVRGFFGRRDLVDRYRALDS